MDETRCSAQVSGEGQWGAFHPHQCHKKAVVMRDGKPYCKVHDPEYREQKSAKATTKWEAKMKKHRLEVMAPVLLDACQRAYEATHDPIVEQILLEAINKAEGEV